MTSLIIGETGLIVSYKFKYGNLSKISKIPFSRFFTMEHNVICILMIKVSSYVYQGLRV